MSVHLNFWARDFDYGGGCCDMVAVRVRLSSWADVEFAKQQLEAEDSEYYR